VAHAGEYLKKTAFSPIFMTQAKARICIIIKMTYQTAQVVIKNNTQKPLKSVNAAHKYSTNYKNKGDWGPESSSPTPAPGEISSPMLVEYNTGFLTTGEDWWLVTWQYEGDLQLYFTNPNNGMDIWQYISSPISSVIDSVLDDAGLSAGKVIIDSIINSEDVSGFHEHLLTEVDAEQQTTIVIHADNTVEWQSPSGTSTVGWGVHGQKSNADFMGACGEGQVRGVPMVVTSAEGLQVNGQVNINGNKDLSTCMIGNNGACVYGISLTKGDGTRIYDYVLNVDAKGPEGFGSGSMYLAFTDDSGDTYHLSIYSSTRSMHKLRYNSERPVIKKIFWSDYSF
jgi:hypothetical protein